MTTDDQAGSVVPDLDAIHQRARDTYPSQAFFDVRALVAHARTLRADLAMARASYVSAAEEASALRAEVAAVNDQMEQMAREMGGQMDLVDQLTTDNARLRTLLGSARSALDDWSRADLDGVIDAIDAALAASPAPAAGQEERG